MSYSWPRPGQSQKSHHMPESTGQTLVVSELNHFPGETVPVPSHSLLQEASLSIQPKPPLTWLHAVPLGPVTGQREETSASPSTSLLKEGVDHCEVSSSASWTDQVNSATSRMVSILSP